MGEVKGGIYVEHDSMLLLYDDEDISWPRIEGNRSARCDWASSVYGGAVRGPARSRHKLHGGRWNAISLGISEHVRPRVWRFAVSRCGMEEKVGRYRFDGHHYGRTWSQLHLWGHHGTGVSQWKERHRVYKNVHSVRAYRYRHQLGRYVGAEFSIGKVDVDLHVLNDGASGMLKEFSYDERYLLPMTMVYLLVLSGMLYVQMKTMRKIGERVGKYLVRAITCVVLFEFVSVLISFYELFVFALYGTERIDRVHPVRVVSALLDEGSQVGLVLLVLMLGNGWMIMTPRIKEGSFLVRASWTLIVANVFATVVAILGGSDANYMDEWHSVVGVLLALSQVGLVLLGFVSWMGNVKALKGSKPYKGEERYNARLQCFGYVWLLLFALLVEAPLLAILSQCVDPWNRSWTLVMVTMVFHGGSCGVVVHGFRYSVLEKLYDMKGRDGRIGDKDDDDREKRRSDEDEPFDEAEEESDEEAPLVL